VRRATARPIMGHLPMPGMLRREARGVNWPSALCRGIPPIGPEPEHGPAGAEQLAAEMR
jgi:hypothetical protein